jgi:hypothetical protein
MALLQLVPSLADTSIHGNSKEFACSTPSSGVTNEKIIIINKTGVLNFFENRRAQRTINPGVF